MSSSSMVVVVWAVVAPLAATVTVKPSAGSSAASLTIGTVTVVVVATVPNGVTCGVPTSAPGVAGAAPLPATVTVGSAGSAGARWIV